MKPMSARLDDAAVALHGNELTQIHPRRSSNYLRPFPERGVTPASAAGTEQLAAGRQPQES